jgi:ABC-type sulfate/molybdate transport systems ATPase subunit
MQELIKLMNERFALTTILVSHDILEVARVCKKVFMLENGKVSRSGTAADVVPFQHIETMLKTIEQNFTSGKQ